MPGTGLSGRDARLGETGTAPRSAWRSQQWDGRCPSLAISVFYSGEGLPEEVSRHMSFCAGAGHGGLHSSCLQSCSAPGYTLTTLSDLGCFPGPHRQGGYKLSLGLGLQTIHSFSSSTNPY